MNRAKIRSGFSRLHLYGFLLSLLCANEVFCAQNNTTTGRTDPSQPPPSDNGHCIWYGECHHGNGLSQNCVYDGPPKPLNASGMQLIQKWCPFMNTSVFCCDERQMTTLHMGISLAANLLKRSPSCMLNFVKPVCYLTCSPRQSDFLEINGTDVNPTNNRSYVTAVNYYITQDYLDKVYNSCKQVSIPSTDHQLALDIMCGDWGAVRCTSNRWFEYMGTGSSNPFVPFQINYINSTSEKVGNYTPLDPSVP